MQEIVFSMAVAPSTTRGRLFVPAERSLGRLRYHADTF